MVLVDKPLIVVTGATGKQGGSVARFLLADGTFRVRALTRRPDTVNARELAHNGVDVVAADYTDFTSLVAAFKGAYGVFGVTNYWESFSGVKEESEGIALVDAAKACGVQHFVWSTVAANSKRDVEHWTSKAHVDAHLRASNVPRTSLKKVVASNNTISASSSTSSLSSYSFISANESLASTGTHTTSPALAPASVPIIDSSLIKPEAKAADHTVASSISTPIKSHTYIAEWPLLLTDGPIGGYSVNDTGAYVLAAFKNPHEWIDKDMYIPPDVFTPRMFVNVLNEALALRGERESLIQVQLKETNDEAFVRARELGAVIGGAEQMWNNMANFYDANGRMRHFSTAKESISDAKCAEEIEKAVYQERISMSEFVHANVDELLAAAREVEE